MFELIPVGLALAAACVANYTDLKKRIIPNKLTLPLIPIGIAFYICWGAYQRDLMLAISGVVGAAFAFAIGYAMWLSGGWAGGDVKLFTAFGALVPIFSPAYSRAPYSSNYPFFPITVLFNSVIVILPILLVYTIICRARGRGAFYEQVKITQLKEGMIPAEVIYEKNGKVGRWSSRLGLGKPGWDRVYSNPSRAAGLTRYQVGALKKLVRAGKLSNSIRIKKGMPFAPALGAGLLIAVVYGDIYWRIVAWLTGVSAQLLTLVL